VEEAGDRVAVGGGDPKVGRASVKDDGECLRRGADIDVAIVLLLEVRNVNFMQGNHDVMPLLR